MAQARWSAAAAVLPDGKVLVAGGKATTEADSALKTAELYDPATNAWTALPDMAHKRSEAAACVLPSGRVAVMSGCWADGEERKDGEAFDPVKRTWEPLPEMCGARGSPAAEPVAGGMIVSGRDEAELFDEETGQWLKLPHPMAQPLGIAQLVSLPASALQAAAAAAGAGH
jgi:N-acetylneuraminic acid mutarotase